MLKVSDLRLKYPNGQRKIFNHLNITIQDKEKVLLLGPSGCGKSTLLNVLSGIVPNLIELPMKYDELIIDSLSGVIFQDPDSQFCMPKVYEELAFVLENRQVPRQDMDELIIEALNMVNLNVTSATYVKDLSGGMKQKLAIVETILQQSKTLFLDEPTAMLDVQATKDLWSKLIELWENQTVVIVEHKVNHIWQHVDRVILMDYAGNIIADANPDTILNKYDSLLTEYGVWHPKAWEHAPKHVAFPASKENLLHFNEGRVIRGKSTLFTFSDLKIDKGEWITITGANGSGKTTLLESIMQLIKYQGSVHFQNQRLTKIKHAAKNMYLVYQNPELQFITNSVYEEINIHFNHLSKNESNNETMHLLKLLNLEDVKDQHPFELSIGQKRRLSVATALSSKADIIFLDEPTFGLDSHNTFELIKLFQQRIQTGQSIVMVTHDDEIIARYPSKRLKIPNGKLIDCDGDINV